MSDTLPDGVALTKVEINAMTPDVVAAVLKQITDNVLKLIPEGSLEKIAKEVMSSGRICTKQKDHWGDWKDKEYLVLADEAKKMLADKIKPMLEKQVYAYFETAEVQGMIQQAVSDGVATALGEIHAVVAKTALQRLTGVMLNEAPPELTNVACNLSVIRSGVQRAHQALVAKGVLLPYEAPLAGG